MIAMSGVIGSNMYVNDGKTLEVAGPGGAITSFTIVGIIAISVMECVSEMVQLFPTPNAMVEYVKVFVDADLAWIIGVAYWQDDPLTLLRTLN
jgi:yeast amino acid transporter